MMLYHELVMLIGDNMCSDVHSLLCIYYLCSQHRVLFGYHMKLDTLFCCTVACCFLPCTFHHKGFAILDVPG